MILQVRKVTPLPAQLYMVEGYTCKEYLNHHESFIVFVRSLTSAAIVIAFKSTQLPSYPTVNDLNRELKEIEL